MSSHPTPISLLTTLLGACACLSAAQTQLIEADYSVPTLDRWNYPFNGSPGTRLTGSTFGAVELDGFDDHDAQLLLGFDTFNEVTTGLDAAEYRVLRATVTITNSNGDEFRYDPTYDTHDTYEFLDESFDPDPGRPVHLWSIGYRNGFDQTTFGEFTAFGGPPVVAPAQESRYAFAAYFPDGPDAVDISNNLKEEFDPTPMAVGFNDSLIPGDTVPENTALTFEVDLCDPMIRAYLAQGLSLGEVRFAVTSLHSANGGKGGGKGDVSYPFWYTKENPIAQLLGYTPTLSLEVRIGSAGDYNADGLYDFFDVSAFLDDFGAGNPAADLTGDCVFDFFDVSDFLDAFATR